MAYLPDGEEEGFDPMAAMGPLTRAGFTDDGSTPATPMGPLGSSAGPWARGVSAVGNALAGMGRAVGPYIAPLVRAGGNALLANATGNPMAPAMRDAAYAQIAEGNQRTQILQEESNRRNRLERLQLHRQALQQELFQKVAENPNLGPKDYRRFGLMLAASGDTESGLKMMELAKGKAPTTRTIQVGTENVSQEWNPETQGWDEVGRGEKKIGGVNIGGITINAEGNQALTKSMQTTSQGKVMSLNDSLAGLNEVKATYEPEFLQIGTQFKHWGDSWGEKFGRTLPPGEKAAFEKYSTFRGDALAHMSLILNQLSGAAISPAEFERLSGSLPNPGTGIGDGDSPTQFEAKLKARYRDTQLALVRWKFASENGIPFESMALSESYLKHKIGMAAEKRALDQHMTQEQADAAGEAAVRDAFSGFQSWK